VQVLVTRVVSPHTLEVAMADDVARRASTHVRLWGVTAPLPAGPDRDAQPFSDEAMLLTQRLVENTSVILQLESHRTRDPFNRLLAHVELDGGGTLNEALLEAGLARADERWPHSMLVRYAQAQQNARRRGEGVWQ
jgi:endonuclease YncB( thermonuclease family)